MLVTANIKMMRKQTKKIKPFTYFLKSPMYEKLCDEIVMSNAQS